MCTHVCIETPSKPARNSTLGSPPLTKHQTNDVRYKQRKTLSAHPNSLTIPECPESPRVQNKVTLCVMLLLGLQQCTLRGVTEPRNSEGHHYFGGATESKRCGNSGFLFHLNPVYPVDVRELQILKIWLVGYQQIARCHGESIGKRRQSWDCLVVLKPVRLTPAEHGCSHGGHMLSPSPPSAGHSPQTCTAARTWP